MNLFKIKDLDFDIVKAVFKGHISEELSWSISIKAQYPGGRFRGEEWEPRAYSERLFPIDGKILDHWSDVLGQALEWDDGYDKRAGAPIASLYVFEHLDIYRSKLMLGPLTGKDSFEVDWKAQCEVFAGDDYGKDLDLSIQTEVKFEGIEVPFREEEVSVALLREHIRQGEYTFDPGDGKHKKPIFRPN